MLLCDFLFYFEALSSCLMFFSSTFRVMSISTGCIYSVCPLMSSLLSFVTHLCVLHLSHLPALFHWASSSDSLLAIVFFSFVPCIFTGLWYSLSSSGIRGPGRHNMWFPAAGITGPCRPPARPQKAFWTWSRLAGNPRVWNHRGLTEACEEWCTTVVKTKAWISLSELI